MPMQIIIFGMCSHAIRLLFLKLLRSAFGQLSRNSLLPLTCVITPCLLIKGELDAVLP